MPQLRVFVSSTAYDLGPVREQLRATLVDMGHQPVLSDYSGVLYDPSQHTAQSCLDELATCDVVVLIIGNRWGSETPPSLIQALEETESDIENGTPLGEAIKNRKVSITQLEALTAFRRNIPIFAFIHESAKNEKDFYFANQDLAKSGQLKLPSGNDIAAAGYIAGFVDYIESRKSGNAITPFARIEDLQRHLRLQWSAWLQRILREQADAQAQQTLMDILDEKLEDIKAAMVATAPTANAKVVARGVMRYRTLLAFIATISKNFDPSDAAAVELDWGQLLKRLGVSDVHIVEDSKSPRSSAFNFHAIIMTEKRPYGWRGTPDRLEFLSQQWEEFRKIPREDRDLIAETLGSEPRHLVSLRPISASLANAILGHKNSGLSSEQDPLVE